MIRERGAERAPTALYVENWFSELTAKIRHERPQLRATPRALLAVPGARLV